MITNEFKKALHDVGREMMDSIISQREFELSRIHRCVYKYLNNGDKDALDDISLYTNVTDMDARFIKKLCDDNYKAWDKLLEKVDAGEADESSIDDFLARLAILIIFHGDSSIIEFADFTL